ncbi:hypothetical protein PQX77_021198 [Marasmius sp. AFHP31]|nr:hypothetical protein PQX77_021198 [Marasmius sp. AFHP31]
MHKPDLLEIVWSGYPLVSGLAGRVGLPLGVALVALNVLLTSIGMVITLLLIKFAISCWMRWLVRAVVMLWINERDIICQRRRHTRDKCIDTSDLNTIFDGLKTVNPSQSQLLARTIPATVTIESAPISVSTSKQKQAQVLIHNEIAHSRIASITLLAANEKKLVGAKDADFGADDGMHEQGLRKPMPTSAISASPASKKPQTNPDTTEGRFSWGQLGSCAPKGKHTPSEPSASSFESFMLSGDVPSLFVFGATFPSPISKAQADSLSPNPGSCCPFFTSTPAQTNSSCHSISGRMCYWCKQQLNEVPADARPRSMTPADGEFFGGPVMVMR